MTISLPESIEKLLRNEASRRGLGAEQLASLLIQERLSGGGEAAQPNSKMLDLLDQWDEEDQTDDPAEIARRQQDFEEFKQAINESHSSNRKIYP